MGGWALGIGQKTLVTCDKRAAGDNNTPECFLWPTLAAQSPAVLIMNELVVDAIHRKLRMSVTYHGAMRIIEPQCYGIAHTAMAVGMAVLVIAFWRSMNAKQD